MSDVPAVAAPAAPEAPAIDTAPPAVGSPPPEVAKEEPKLSLDDTLSAAWDKAQTGVDRGDNGKFVAKDKPADTPEPELAVQPTPEPVEPAKPAIDAPQSWTAEAKAHWAKLPPEAQDYILKRESEAHKAITSQGDRLKSFETLDKLLSDYRDDFARHAVAPDQGIRALLEAQRMFDQHPLAAATTLLAQRGIDLRAILSGQAQAPTSDPMVGQLQQKLSKLEQELSQYKQETSAAQQAADSAMVKEFAKDKPYFDDVRAVMASLMKDGHAETLQAAYDMATKAHPTISKRIEIDQRKADDEKRKAEETKKQDELKKRAEEAAKAAKVNVKSGTSVPTPKTMDDTLQEIARRAYG
jgi:hypothetical protein